LVATPPPLVSNSAYDALIAGLVEYHLERKKLPLPKWLAEKSRWLKEPWFVDEIPTLHKKIQARTPRSFSKRNAFISEAELVSL
jgi:hypothetical protein